MRTSLRLLLALLVSSCFTLPLQAQIPKGSVLLGGSLNYTRNHSQYQSTQSSRSTSTYQGVGLAPIAGYFIADNLVVGTSLSGSIGRSVQNDKLSNKSSAWGAGPFARYYKFVGEKFAFFGQAGFNFYKSTYKSRDAAGELKPNQTLEQFNIAVQPGISYFPIPRLGFQLTMGSLGYYKTDNKYQVSQPENLNGQIGKSFIANFGMDQLAVGINVLFSK
jgi:hypothetical protein